MDVESALKDTLAAHDAHRQIFIFRTWERLDLHGFVRFGGLGQKFLDPSGFLLCDVGLLRFLLGRVGGQLVLLGLGFVTGIGLGLGGIGRLRGVTARGVDRVRLCRLGRYWLGGFFMPASGLALMGIGGAGVVAGVTFSTLGRVRAFKGTVMFWLAGGPCGVAGATVVAAVGWAPGTVITLGVASVGPPRATN